MEQNYEILMEDESGNQQAQRELASFLRRNGQFLIPMMELIEQSRVALDEVIDVVGRATIRKEFRRFLNGRNSAVELPLL